MININKCVEELLIIYNKKPEDWLKYKNKNFSGYIAYDFFYAILSSENLHIASTKLKCSVRTIQRTMKELNLNETFSSRGGNIRFYLLQLLNYKYCNNCNLIFSSKNFSKALDGTLRSFCRQCAAEKFSIYYSNNKEKILVSVYARTEHILKATPKWANLEKIKEIYKNCPIGYEVDHIAPLRGKNVCGLHVENNLQYLTKAENRSKSNNWVVS